jgi:hypothetical protein
MARNRSICAWNKTAQRTVYSFSTVTPKSIDSLVSAHSCTELSEASSISTYSRAQLQKTSSNNMLNSSALHSCRLITLSASSCPNTAIIILKHFRRSSIELWLLIFLSIFNMVCDSNLKPNTIKLYYLIEKFC